MTDRSDLLAEAVLRIGRGSFGAALMAALARHAGAGMCSAFALGRDGPVVLVAESADAGRSPFARIASLRYARSYWRRDTDTLYNLGRAHRSVLTARRPARAIRDMEYRLECYGAGDVGERLSICRRGPRDIIVNAYRDAGAGPFDRAAMEWIEEAAEVVVAAVTRHQELVAAPAPGTPDVTATTAALCALPCGLSQREAEVIAHALAGAGQAETAAAIGVALSSVATYRRRAYAKLGRSDRRGVRALLQDRPE